jgi:heme exporter protein CcmD
MKPQFDSLAAFAAMGGHSGFVFGAWGLSLLVVIGLIITSTSKARKQKSRVEALERDKP